jgi:hypothetical protein
MPTLEATWRRGGNPVPHRRPGTVIAGARAFPRGRVRACWKEDAEANLLVVAPLRFGHRSVPGDDMPRRWTRMHGEFLLRGATEQSRHAVW